MVRRKGRLLRPALEGGEREREEEEREEREVRREKAMLSMQADEDCFPPGRTRTRLAMGQPPGSE